MFEIILNILLGIALLVVSWKSTVFKGRTLLHVIVGVLIVGLGFFNGYKLYQKDDIILNLSEQTDSLRFENKELIAGQKIMIEQMESIQIAITYLDEPRFSNLAPNKVIDVLINDYLILKKEIAEVEEKTELPKLYFDSKDIKRLENEVRLTLTLKPTNNIPIGRIRFDVAILGKNNVKIISFGGGGGSSSASPGSFSQALNSYEWVSSDKKRSYVEFNPGSFRNIILNLRLSGDAEIVLYSKEYFERSRISTFK